VAAVCILGAVSAGVVTLLRPADAFASAVAAAALAVLAPSRWSAKALLVVCALSLAAAHGAAARDRALHPSLLGWFDAQAGDADRLLSPIDIDGVLAADAALIDDGVRLIVDVEGLRMTPAVIGVSGRVQLHVSGDQAAGHLREWCAGRRIHAPVLFRRPQMLLNFGGPSPFWQRLRRSFALAGSIKSAALVEVDRGALWQELAAGARWRARDAVARFIAPLDARAAGVVTAILIGDRAGLDDEVVRGLQLAGTYHVIAISGGNVALLMGLCFGLLRLAIRSSRPVAVITLIVTLAYAAVVGGDPSVSRAVTAAAIYLTVSLTGLQPSPVATLRTTALVIALADPLVVCDVGAWLSFGATFGILSIAPRVIRAIPWDRAPRALTTVGRPIVLLGAATLAAEIMLLPISAAVFGRVTAAGLVLNLVAIPAMAIVEIAGLLAVCAGPLWPPVGDAAAHVAASGAQILVASSLLVEWWPWLWWRVPNVSTLWVAAYYAAGRRAVVTPKSVWSRRAVPIVAAAGVTLIATHSLIRQLPAPSPPLRVSLIDVGQGDAILVQFPSGQVLLVDAGGSPGAFDVGARIVTPSAWALGVRSLTWLALTHGDRDHVGGAYGVTEDLWPTEIWEGIPVWANRDLARLRLLASSRGIAWRSVRAGARLDVGAVQIDTLHPVDPDWERPRVRNDDSMVLRIQYGRVAMLLTGDAGGEFESRASADLADAPIRILKVGHHGSRTSTSERLVDVLRPQAALISVGRGNAFGHPSPEVIDRLRRIGTEVFRTDRDGAISVESDGVMVRIVDGAWPLVDAGCPRPLLTTVHSASSSSSVAS
jgi:competence protein ComEC